MKTEKRMALENAILKLLKFLSCNYNALYQGSKPFQKANLVRIDTASEELVPIRHIYRTNISHSVKYTHIVKFYIACMRIPHIDKIPTPQSAAFCIRFQFCTVLALTSVPIKYQNFTSVIILYQFCTCVRIGTNSSHL